MGKLKDLESGIDAPEDTESTDQPAKKKSKKETKVHADNTERGKDVPENTDSTDQPAKKKSKKETKVHADNTEVTDHSVKKKSKKEKETEQPEVSNHSTNSSQDKFIPCKDPGWDFTATSVSAPAWQEASIWSDDELDDEIENEGIEEKSHVSKAEAKRRKKIEEEQAAARE